MKGISGPAVVTKVRGYVAGLLDKVSAVVSGERSWVPGFTRSTPKISVMEVSLTMRDAVFGTRKIVEIPGARPEQSQKVSIRIPGGVRNGSIIRLKAKAGTHDELVFIARVASHPFLTLLPKGLVAEIPVTVGEALLGASITVPTLDDPVVVKIPAGMQSGQEIRLKERGIPQKDGTKGDLFLRLLVRLPDGNAEKLRESVQALDKNYARPVRQGLPQTLIE
jgi:hypothetical protein